MWQRAPTSGRPPAARDSHSCSSWKNNIVVIGGEDEHDYYLCDVHILDTGLIHFLKYCKVISFNQQTSMLVLSAIEVSKIHAILVCLHKVSKGNVIGS